MKERTTSGYQLSPEAWRQTVLGWSGEMDVHAPCRMPGRGRFAGQDVIRYQAINDADDIEWRRKSDFSAKDVLFPPNETMFHLLGESFKPAPPPDDAERPLLLFCRACDIHGIDRLDRIFLGNGAAPDPYYQRRRRRVRFALIECAESRENCFCVSMQSNVVDDYALAVRFLPTGGVLVELRDETLPAALPDAAQRIDFTPQFVQEDSRPVTVPPLAALTREIENNDFFDHPLWAPYSRRCIACGRCNFSCPTCSCFTTFDAVCEHAPELGVRRRVWAGCHVDRFTAMAGGHDVRVDYASRMRFKSMHKIYDYALRFGVHMCVGCGRCDDQCPEYISFSACINRVNQCVVEQEAREGDDEI